MQTTHDNLIVIDFSKLMLGITIFMLNLFTKLLPYAMMFVTTIDTAYAVTSVLKNPQSGKCLDVAGGGTADGTKVQLWTCNGTKAQDWEIVAKSDPVTPPPVVTVPPPVVTPPPVTGDKQIVAYFQSWSAPWASKGADHSLAKLPPYIKTVLLAFSRPDISYARGSNTLSGTGLDFSADFAVVKEAIAIAQSKGTRVILSVGGATYYNWAGFNAQAVANLASDLGVSGIDLDYEDMQQVCSWGTGGTSCPKDNEFIDIIRKARAAWPRPKMLTTAAWSTGAYGPSPYSSSQMDGRQIGSNFGMYVNPLKQAGDLFDEIYIMSYDAGSPSTTGYDWRKALEAYRALYKGRIFVGIESAPEAWGGNVSDENDAKLRAAATNGFMIWSYQKPGGAQLMKAGCTQLGLSGCEQAAPAIKGLGQVFHTKVEDKFKK